MKKTLTISTLVLLSLLVAAPSFAHVPDAANTDAFLTRLLAEVPALPSADAEPQQLAASCTICCTSEPGYCCTSAAGDCVKTAHALYCDGRVRQLCPSSNFAPAPAFQLAASPCYDACNAEYFACINSGQSFQSCSTQRKLCLYDC